MSASTVEAGPVAEIATLQAELQRWPECYQKCVGRIRWKNAEQLRRAMSVYRGAVKEAGKNHADDPNN